MKFKEVFLKPFISCFQIHQWMWNVTAIIKTIWELFNSTKFYEEKTDCHLTCGHSVGALFFISRWESGNWDDWIYWKDIPTFINIQIQQIMLEWKLQCASHNNNDNQCYKLATTSICFEFSSEKEVHILYSK